MTTRSVTNFYIDIGFTVVFTTCFVTTAVLAIKAFKVNPQMVSLPNILVAVFIQLTLLSKFLLLKEILICL